jgi:peptide/nickel transport system substrate-binding protein
MQTTWNLRPEATWHDGTPFTSDDLAFTLEISRDREMVAFGGHVGFDSIDSFNAPDAHTFTVNWRSAFAEADTLFTKEFANPIPKHLVADTYLSNKSAVMQMPYWTQEFVGTGPFRITNWVSGSHMILQAFENFALGRPKIDSIEIKFVQDPYALVPGLLSGTIDLNLGRGISLDQALQVRDQWPQGTMQVGLVNQIVMYPQFLNPDPVIILNTDFRKALMHAMNRQELADTLQYGLTPVAHSWVDTALPQYSGAAPSVVRYDYDVRKAQQLIEGLGYRLGTDGIFRDASEQKLTVEIRTTGEQDIQVKTMLPIGEYWQRMGVATNTVVLGLQQRTDRAFRSVRPGFELLKTPDSNKGLKRHHSRETPLPENNFSKSGNTARYISPEFDSLVDRYFTTIPTAERIDILGQILHLTSDQVTYMPLFRGIDPILVANRLVGVGPRKSEYGTEVWNAQDWDIK